MQRIDLKKRYLYIRLVIVYIFLNIHHCVTLHQLAIQIDTRTTVWLG